MRTGRSAHLADAEPWEVRGRPRPHSGLVQGSNADREVRAPRRRRSLGGARTSSSAFRPGARFNADREVRAPRRRRTLGGARASSSAFRPRAGSMRTGRSAHLDAAELGRCADVLVRIPVLCKVQCGPGGPRTSTPPNSGRCADVLVRIPGRCKGRLRTGTFAYAVAFSALGGRRGRRRFRGLPSCLPWLVGAGGRGVGGVAAVGPTPMSRRRRVLWRSRVRRGFRAV